AGDLLAVVEDAGRVFCAGGPSVLVLDGLEALPPGAARSLVTRLARHVPPGATLALASRGEPELPLGRLRAQDDVAELRADALAMTRPEAAELLRRAGLTLTARRFDRLYELTAGGPAARR